MGAISIPLTAAQFNHLDVITNSISAGCVIHVLYFLDFSYSEEWYLRDGIVVIYVYVTIAIFGL